MEDLFFCEYCEKTKDKDYLYKPVLIHIKHWFSARFYYVCNDCWSIEDYAIYEWPEYWPWYKKLWRFIF